jgi:hypothetical protein
MTTGSGESHRISFPSGASFHASQSPASSHPSQKKNWSQRLPSFRPPKPSREAESGHQQQLHQSNMSRQHSRSSGGSAATASTERWWKVHLFQGMVKDIRRRTPYYWSDWTDAWDYRVVPATVYMYFAKYGPDNANVLFSFTALIFNLQSLPHL